MGEHSKGPWVWGVHDGLNRLYDARGRVIATGDYRRGVTIEGKENATLIVSAPQLLDHLQRWHVAAHPRGDDSCETCQFLRSKGLPITTPGDGRR